MLQYIYVLSSNLIFKPFLVTHFDTKNYNFGIFELNFQLYFKYKK